MGYARVCLVVQERHPRGAGENDRMRGTGTLEGSIVTLADDAKMVRVMYTEISVGAGVIYLHARHHSVFACDGNAGMMAKPAAGSMIA